MNNSKLSSIDTAIDAYGQGKMVIIVDDEDRENEGDVVLAADFATPEAINFMVTHARGLVCLAMRGALLDRLKIPMMVPQAHNRSGFGTGFTISVEANNGVSTGISAEDRSHTIRTLINPNTTPDDIAMPGHMFPLRARDGGVLERRGQTEASVDLSALAGLTPAGIICEVMREDGTMMRLEELMKFGQEHGLPVISVEQLANFRLSLNQGNMATAVDSASKAAANFANEADTPETKTLISVGASSVAADSPDYIESNTELVTEIGRSTLPTEHGNFDIIIFRDQQGFEHSALIKGDINSDSSLVRLHSECLSGDAFGSLRCDCGPQLHAAMHKIEEAGHGIVLYLRQEGRGIGLGNKIRAYSLQDEGRDTVDANHELGFPADARSYEVAAAMLGKLGISRVQLLSNNPAKQEALQSLGIDVTQLLPLVIEAQAHNADYLDTKAKRMGHHFN